MSLLFGRHVEVTLESVSGETKTFIHDSESGELFRIDFEVSFDGNSTIKLYNVLNETVRMCEPKLQPQKKYAKIKLIAGYPDNFSLLASGDIVQFSSKRSNTDSIFELKISPKPDLLNEIAAPKNYNGTWQSILKQVLTDNGITYYEINTSQGTIDKVDQFIVTGTLKETLDKITKSALLEYFFELNKLIIVSKGEGRKTLASEKVILKRDTGLIDRPHRKGVVWSVKSLLNTRINKGRTVKIVSVDDTGSAMSGDYKVTNGKHYGSSWTNDFYTEFEFKA